MKTIRPKCTGSTGRGSLSREGRRSIGGQPRVSQRSRRDKRFRYVVFNKPYGFLSQFNESDGHPGLSAFALPSGVYAAGRLDRDSEGLMLLTDDGSLIERLLAPRWGHRRTYWVQVEGIPGPEALDALRQGVVIKGQTTRPCCATVLPGPPDIWKRDPPIRYRATIPDCWIEITLTEGRNRQVRRMTAAVGYPTLRLVRVALANLSLGRPPVTALAPGEWREIDREDIRLW